MRFIFFPVLWVCCCISCTTVKTIKPFQSDGCSMFPDRSLISEDDWCTCCEIHDLAYWQGGTREQRESADRALRDCFLRKTGDSVLAELVFRGVRLGGNPYFPTWYRWGYGWTYQRGYAPLSPEEREIVKRALDGHLKNRLNQPE